MKKLLSSGLAIGAMISLVGCGGGSSSSSTPTTPEASVIGNFIDAAVKGLFYKTETQEGYTDENGSYKCNPGEQVTFSIGNYLELGTTECGVLASPLSLTDDTQEQQNMAYLLQNLDLNQSNGDMIDVSNFKEYNLTDINLSESGFNMSVLEGRDENLSDLLDPDYAEISKTDARTNMETAVSAAEDELGSGLDTFISGNTFKFVSPDTEGDVVISFESNGNFIDNDGCEGTWEQTDYNMVEVTGGCAISLKFIGTPADGVSVEANVTDEIPAGELFTGTLTTVGTNLKEYVTGNGYVFDEQSAPGDDFFIYYGANGSYSDEDLESFETCTGSWIATADDTIAVPSCGVEFKFPVELTDGMTININVDDITQETFTGTLTETAL